MSVQFISIRLGVGETRAINTAGRVFICDTASDSFTLRVDNSAEINFTSKRVFGSSTSAPFRRVTLRNLSVSANTILYAITESDFKIEQQIASVIATITVASQKNAPTSVSGSGIVALADGASSVAITNTNGKQFAVRNHTSSTGSLQIKDGSGNIMDVLQPGDAPWTLETSGTFILTASGGAVNYSWSKVTYV